MKISLAVNAFAKYLFGVLLVGALLFLPAGTLDFFNAWFFILLLFVPMLFLGIILLIKAPKLLEKRLSSREKEGTQKGVVCFFALLFLLGFILAGLDFRFEWFLFSRSVVYCGGVLLLASYALYAEVMRENAHLSRTIQVQDGQKLVTTGLYGIVRHPMYFASLILFLSFSLVLGSLLTLICFLLFIPLFVIRILNEEKVLSEGLEGYREYCAKVKYRLIPFIW